MKKSNQVCQSCGMPMKNTAMHGTNADGSPNNKYCSLCFESGRFVQPELSVDQMQDIVKAKMKEMFVPGFIGGFYAKRISKLERWKTN